MKGGGQILVALLVSNLFVFWVRLMDFHGCGASSQRQLFPYRIATPQNTNAAVQHQSPQSTALLSFYSCRTRWFIFIENNVFLFAWFFAFTTSKQSNAFLQLPMFLQQICSSLGIECVRTIMFEVSKCNELSVNFLPAFRKASEHKIFGWISSSLGGRTWQRACLIKRIQL